MAPHRCQGLAQTPSSPGSPQHWALPTALQGPRVPDPLVLDCSRWLCHPCLLAAIVPTVCCLMALRSHFLPFYLANWAQTQRRKLCVFTGTWTCNPRPSRMAGTVSPSPWWSEMEIPVNVRFCLEGMEESGSEGLDELIFARRDTFFQDVDYVCISDNYWLGKKKPCVTYGLRGICYFFIEVECSDKDLHSGVYGGSVHEAMTDLISLMGSLLDRKGRILVPGINEAVAPVTDEELALYDNIDFDMKEYTKDVGATALLHSCEKDILMHRWRYPSLSLHGIEGAFSGAGAKTVIPKKVIGKFSIRLVPNMTPDVVSEQVTSYLTKKFAELHSPNKFKVYLGHGGKPWVSDFNHPHYLAGRRALKTVFGIEPDLTREGGSIPVTLTFQEATGKNVMLLPVGSADDGAHSQNEKLNRLHDYIHLDITELLILPLVSSKSLESGSRWTVESSPGQILGGG
ncbi:cytosolic non-specific dipeptidase isoform X3 [Tamandua tetradactyla]|uniref:cytosolic non-specific dipeptidase isoform X3 n=1 Tax=Tamandua tetradactyla TaxID=48850 RepID=UPI004053BABC